MDDGQSVLAAKRGLERSESVEDDEPDLASGGGGTSRTASADYADVGSRVFAESFRQARDLYSDD